MLQISDTIFCMYPLKTWQPIRKSVQFNLGLMNCLLTLQVHVPVHHLAQKKLHTLHNLHISSFCFLIVTAKPERTRIVLNWNSFSNIFHFVKVSGTSSVSEYFFKRCLTLVANLWQILKQLSHFFHNMYKLTFYLTELMGHILQDEYIGMPRLKNQ